MKDPAHTARESRDLTAAMAQLHHRGPDDRGSYECDGLLLGHRRLSILDLSPAGRQPMASPDGRFVVSLNGEIYNYLELRTELALAGRAFHTGTDTEVLLASFAEWGPSCLNRFRGMFAFALWDTVTSRLFLARDRVGEKPLYYWYNDERFVFASELRALLKLTRDVPALSAGSVNAYLHYPFAIEPDTILEDVHKLPAGHILALRDGQWPHTPPPFGGSA